MFLLSQLAACKQRCSVQCIWWIAVGFTAFDLASSVVSKLRLCWTYARIFVATTSSQSLIRFPHVFFLFFGGRPSRAYAGASVFEVCWLASRPFTGGFTKRPRLQSGGHFRCCTALRRPLFKSQKRFWLRPGGEPRNLVRPGGVRRYLAPRLRGWPELHFVDFRRVATKPEGRYTQPHVVGRVRSVTAVCSLSPTNAKFMLVTGSRR